MSRAYYGVFGKIHQRLEINGIIPTHANVHQEVINWLENYPDVEVQFIGRELDKLRRERNRCDYNGKILISKERAEKYIILARLIIANAQKSKLL